MLDSEVGIVLGESEGLEEDGPLLGNNVGRSVEGSVEETTFGAMLGSSDGPLVDHAVGHGLSVGLLETEGRAVVLGISLGSVEGDILGRVGKVLGLTEAVGCALSDGLVDDDGDTDWVGRALMVGA